MATTEERLKILKMVEQGKITAEEGARLLAALGSGSRSKDTAAPPYSQAKWMRVRVVDLNTGRNKVNVNIPMSLVNVGIKMGARFAPDLEDVDYAEILEAIRSGAQGKIVDVTDEIDGERVEIFIE
ncbi:MAG: SHOCT-like domain-containing protein [Chloroflexota bacterium]